MGHVLSTEASFRCTDFPRAELWFLELGALWWDAPTVLAGGASVPGCHTQNDSLEEMCSQPWYVLLVSI